MFVGRKSTRAKWVVSARSLLDEMPRPSDFPQAHSDGPDADRVLLYGSGRVVGWGRTTHSEALAGSLASALSDMTMRGADVDVIAFPELTVADARRSLLGAKLWRFDVIVINIGLLDALLLRGDSEWRDGLTSLLADIRTSGAPNTRIVVLGIDPVDSISAYQGAHAVAAQHHAQKLDAMSQRVISDLPGVTFLPLESDAMDYSAQGLELADALLEDLNLARASSSAERGPAGQDAASREEERVAGVLSTGILDTPREGRFDRIVTMARQLYGTSGAAFAVVDRDRVWHKSATEGVPVEVSKDQSFCSTTVQQRGPHVVPDMLLENAPGDSSAAEGVGVRFYAGYPIESPSGEQIGALCIFDEKPRERIDVDESLLRQLALLIQAELQVDALGAH